MEPNNESGFLQDFEREIYLEPASTGMRFVNYIIDRILIGVIYKLSSYVISYATLVGADYEAVTSTEYIIQLALVQMGISLLISFCYYASFEAGTGGRTIGKLATRTEAVYEDGKPLDLKGAVLRTLCRMIPFNAISALFGRPWHDRITGTMVVKKP